MPSGSAENDVSSGRKSFSGRKLERFFEIIFKFFLITEIQAVLIPLH